MVGEGLGRALSPTPDPPRVPSPQGEDFSLLYQTEDSATPGKPSVQNDTGAFQ